MENKQPDIFSKSFKGEHSHFGDIIRSARERLDEIDKELGGLQAPRQPTLNMADGRDNNFATDRRSKLMGERADVLRNTMSFVDQATKHNNVETQKEVKDKATYLLDEHNIRAFTGKDAKSFEQMSERFAAMHDDQKSNDPSSRKHVDRASERFSSRLNYARENPSDEVTRFKDISQPTNSREQFNNNLNYKLESVEFKGIVDQPAAPDPKISAREQFNKNLQYPEAHTEAKNINTPSIEEVDIADTLEEPQPPTSNIEDPDKVND